MPSNGGWSSSTAAEVVLKGTYWTDQWSLLLFMEDGVDMYCGLLEARVKGVFFFLAKCGWNFRNRD
uniref:Uncharacterized protein n=1 Tax=Oryza nivara TaxID=4536 RepID=A0A0E0ISX5_ORYNI